MHNTSSIQLTCNEEKKPLKYRVENENGVPKICSYIDGLQQESLESQQNQSEALKTALGAKDLDFANSLFLRCVASTGSFNPNELKSSASEMSAIQSALYSLKPKDEIEGMLITKLIALHYQSTTFMMLIFDEKQSAEIQEKRINHAIKLSRLYNETLDTLMRYKRKGEQKFIIQHVQVQHGGQALVNGAC